jgi:hypothetical protein
VSIGDDVTLKLTLEELHEVDQYGELQTFEAPVLYLLDFSGKPLWKVYPRQLEGVSIWDLFRAAQRIANKLDERVAAIVEDLRKL